MVELKRAAEDKLIHPCDMEDGQIAEIVEWGHGYEGRLIQRFKEYWVCIGKSSGNCYVGLKNSTTLRVRLLEEGDQIIITEN